MWAAIEPSPHLYAIAEGLFTALQRVHAPAEGDVLLAHLPALPVSLAQQPLQVLHLHHNVQQVRYCLLGETWSSGMGYHGCFRLVRANRGVACLASAQPSRSMEVKCGQVSLHTRRAFYGTAVAAV